MLISNVLYNIGLVMFVIGLRKPYLYQFGQFAWTHMILLIVFLQSSFFVANIFEGLIWFVLPASLVIINDIFAYLFGFFFGRTPLIKISPKKTWEGARLAEPAHALCACFAAVSHACLLLFGLVLSLCESCERSLAPQMAAAAHRPASCAFPDPCRRISDDPPTPPFRP